jgi:WD40 repeat protein
LGAPGGHCLRCLFELALQSDASFLALSSKTPAWEENEDRISRYNLLQQIGEGGCGVVYMAEQDKPVRRRVAIKVIKLGMDTKNVIARFEAERQAMALMDHPNIAKVLDAGATDSGRPFFVMELVRGIKITEFCDRNKLSIRERLELFVKVCNAIQHAHQKGVIHRDIKPSNILVVFNDGVPLPKVIDFGIAKATQQPFSDKTVFTGFEHFIGTPAYMSPEQAGLNASGIDTRSDIYSLGVLLYELLTGHPPFDAKSMTKSGIDEMRRVIREQEPRRPSARLDGVTEQELTTAANHRRVEAAKLKKLVQGDLDWIVMKALEKEHVRRYETANALGMDVRRHLDDEPVFARPPGNFYRFQKMVQRNKLAVAAATAVAVALVISVALSTWQFVEKSRAEREQNRLRQEAQKQELAARRKAYAVSMNLLQQALQSDNLGRAVDLLNQQRPRPDQEDLRGWEWRYLWQFCRSDAQSTLCARTNLVSSLSFSRNGRLLAAATEAGDVSVWDVATGKVIFLGGDGFQRVARTTFAPDTDLLAYQDHTNIVIWNSNSGTEASRLPIGEGLNDMAFISGKRLLTATIPGTNNIAIWDTATGALVTNFAAHIFNNWIGTKFAAAPDGNTIAYAVSNQTVQVVDLTHGRADWTFPATEELTTALAFSPDGKILATGGGYTESAIKLWNVQTREVIGQLEGHRSWITCLKFLPDGRLVSGSADQTIRLWDVAARHAVRTFRGHLTDVRSLDVTRDGRTLASGGKDGTVMLWDMAPMTARAPDWQTIDPKYHPGFVRSAAFSPDSRMIAVVENDAVKLYDAGTLRPLLTPDMGLTKPSNRLLFSPDSRLLAGADSSGHVGIWDLPARRRVTNFVANVGQTVLLSFLHDGQSLLTAGADNIVNEWNAANWQKTAHWKLKEDATHALSIISATSASGLLAVRINHNHTMEVISTSDPKSRRRMKCPAELVALAFSPDEGTIAGASEDGSLSLWDSRTLANIDTLRGVLLGLHSVTFSPDGRRIVAGSNGREAIKIWDAVSHEDVGTFEGKGSLFAGACFSPDGNMIAARNWNGMLHIWRAPSWEEINKAEKIR